MNASLSSINIQCFMESCSDVSTMQESHASSLHSYDRSICAMDTDCILEMELLPVATDSPSNKITACSPTHTTITPESTKSSRVQPNKNSMLARRKRGMFRRALSCERLGSPSPCPAENAHMQRPRRRRLRPRRAQSTPENSCLVQGDGSTPPSPTSTLTPEAVAALKSKRWETSTVDTAPPIPRISSRGCCSEGKQQALPRLNRWETDDSIDHSGHSKRKNKNFSFTRGPPQRQSSNSSGRDNQGETKEGCIPKVLSAPNVSQKTLQAAPVLLTSINTLKSMPCLSPTGQGRWKAVRPISRGIRSKGTSLSPTRSSGSRGCPSLPKRQLTPVRSAPKA